MRPRTWVFTAGLRRVAVEASVVMALLLAPFAIVFAGAPMNARWAILVPAGFQFGLFTGVLAAVRLRRPTGAGWRPLGREVGNALVVALCAGLSVALTIIAGAGIAAVGDIGRQLGLDVPRTGALVAIVHSEFGTFLGVVGSFAAIAVFFAYAVGRGLLKAWLGWDHLRRTKLRWTLTHSLLVVSLSLATIVAVFLSASGLIFGSVPAGFGDFLPASAPVIERVLGSIVLAVIPAGIVLFIVPLIVGILIVPPVALISFPVVGRATRRLEALAQTAGALRAGDLSARSPVSGEDEIARLQADFNAMAADLERTMGELRAERDAVGRLLDARRELVASVSHELRTPLATLRGYLDSTLEHWDDRLPDSLLGDLEVMSGEADRLDHLIEDLFTVSRAEVGRLPMTIVPTDVAILLRRIASAMAPLAWNHSRVEVVAQVPDDLPAALVDPERLEQIVRNLLTNAVRHTPPGGLVMVSAALETGMIEIQVRDTGEGIEAGELPLIWDRFYRAGNAQGRSGAGLGLALVKELTEAMGGSVAAESVPGEGSSFTIRVPVAESAAAGQVPGSRALSQIDTVSADLSTALSDTRQSGARTTPPR